jgi:hypothetical protein
MKIRLLSLVVLGIVATVAAPAQMAYYGYLNVSRSGADGYTYAVIQYGYIQENTLTLTQNGSQVSYTSGRSSYAGQPVTLYVAAYSNPPANTLFEMNGEATGELPDAGWFWEPLYRSSVTPPPSVTISGSSDANDGESGWFSLTVDGGTGSSWDWSYSFPAGSGNNPDITFYSPGSQGVYTNARWFASPDTPCAGSPSTYQVTGRAFVESGYYSASMPFRINVPLEGGTTLSPRVVGTVMLIPPAAPGGLWTVGQNNYTRSAPVITINVSPNSQFREKVRQHEDIHNSQFTIGIFAANWSPAAAYERVRGLTDASSAGLSAQVSAAANAYNAEQDAIVQGQMAAVAEPAAYNVSDTVPPLYFYQQSCGRLQ